MYQVTFKYNKENLHIRPEPQGSPLLSDAYLCILKLGLPLHKTVALRAATT